MGRGGGGGVVNNVLKPHNLLLYMDCKIEYFNQYNVITWGINVSITNQQHASIGVYLLYASILLLHSSSL